MLKILSAEMSFVTDQNLNHPEQLTYHQNLKNPSHTQSKDCHKNDNQKVIYTHNKEVLLF